MFVSSTIYLTDTRDGDFCLSRRIALMARFLQPLFVLVISASLVKGVLLPFTDCGSTSMKFLSVYRKQDVVYRGRKISGNFTAEILEDVQGGSSSFKVRRTWFGWPITVFKSPRAPICWPGARTAGSACSFEKGDVIHLSYGAIVPIFLFRGTYSITMQVWNAAGQRIGCVIMEVPLRNEPLPSWTRQI